MTTKPLTKKTYPFYPHENAAGEWVDLRTPTKPPAKRVRFNDTLKVSGYNAVAYYKITLEGDTWMQPLVLRDWSLVWGPETTMTRGELGEILHKGRKAGNPSWGAPLADKSVLHIIRPDFAVPVLATPVLPNVRLAVDKPTLSVWGF
jgi:hypothetical protein